MKLPAATIGEMWMRGAESTCRENEMKDWAGKRALIATAFYFWGQHASAGPEPAWSVIEKAHAAVEMHDYAKADAYLKQGVETELAAIGASGRETSEGRAAADKHQHDAAELEYLRGGIAMYRSKYREAAAHFTRAGQMLPADDSKNRERYEAWARSAAAKADK